METESALPTAPLPEARGCPRQPLSDPERNPRAHSQMDSWPDAHVPATEHYSALGRAGRRVQGQEDGREACSNGPSQSHRCESAAPGRMFRTGRSRQEVGRGRGRGGRGATAAGCRASFLVTECSGPDAMAAWPRSILRPLATFLPRVHMTRVHQNSAPRKGNRQRTGGARLRRGQGRDRPWSTLTLDPSRPVRGRPALPA